MQKIVLILRGHIRNSFNNSKLYDLLNELAQLYIIDIYIHTWTKYEAQSSWRPLNNTNDNIVTVETIENYFNNIDKSTGQFNIKQIIIDDDNLIELIGPVDG